MLAKEQPSVLTLAVIVVLGVFSVPDRTLVARKRSENPAFIRGRLES